MTEKIFWTDPYKTRLNTVVTSLNGTTLTLDQTIFFAFSGGQDGDLGTIGGFEVNDAYLTGGDIYYVLPSQHSLSNGQEVLVEIDWKRRYKLMRLHSAAEIVLYSTSVLVPDIKRIVKNGVKSCNDT